ncbi:jg19394 [Pararge aegeria aegeria]|uniref:Jg19394 protein n=1 Tax=Pararge aegeria aegeria TaxID=348720 RepID=A0A8S4R789_9NEOP|nr:jg19394 [Pararge aegeria aegeria]
MMGKVENKRFVGRRKKSWLCNISERTNFDDLSVARCLVWWEALAVASYHHPTNKDAKQFSVPVGCLVETD